MWEGKTQTRRQPRHFSDGTDHSKSSPDRQEHWAFQACTRRSLAFSVPRFTSRTHSAHLPRRIPCAGRRASKSYWAVVNFYDSAPGRLCPEVASQQDSVDMVLVMASACFARHTAWILHTVNGDSKGREGNVRTGGEQGWPMCGSDLLPAMLLSMLSFWPANPQAPLPSIKLPNRLIRPSGNQ